MSYTYKYSLQDLERMYPFELSMYIDFLHQKAKDKKRAQESQQFFQQARRK